MVLTIPEMHSHLEQLNQFFTEKTTVFVNIMSEHPGQFTSQDHQQFCELIAEIRSQAFARIRGFFSDKHTTKCQLYDSQITTFTDSGQAIESQLNQFREQLEINTVDMKKQQNRKENLLESFSRKYSQKMVYKKVWKVFFDNMRERKEARELDQKMDGVYRRNLFKKAFFPWRTLTYKDGFANTVRRQTQKDISCIHEQYHSIVDILKGKISEVDQMIKVKRAAKGQFAFALSKNLLKSISNLSLEVMSLNQMALRDGECDQTETRVFMKEVDNVIGQKLGKVREYKRALLGEENEGEEQTKRRKKITFL